MKIEILNEKHWHELRSTVIGSSDISSLYGLSMFKSKFTLWHEKAGNFKKEISNNRIDAGNYLEDAIAKMASDKLNIPFVKCNHFYKKGYLGATPDYINSDYVLEVKNMDYVTYKEKCINDNPPKQYILQVMHQLHCTGLKIGYLAIFVGGNDLKIFKYDYRISIGEDMENKAQYFFQSISDNTQPSIENDSDLEVIKSITILENRHVDLSTDNEAVSLCHDLNDATKQRKHYEKIENLSKARIIEKMHGYNTASLGDFNIRLSKSKDIEGQPIIQEMIGQLIGARKGSIRLTIKENK